MDPTMCECVWLTIVAVSVSRFGEENAYVGVRGGGLKEYVFCCGNCGFYFI